MYVLPCAVCRVPCAVCRVRRAPWVVWPHPATNGRVHDHVVPGTRVSTCAYCYLTVITGRVLAWYPRARYDQEAGTMWDQRLKQYLIANGIAVFNINPYIEDQWDNYASAWKSGNGRAPVAAHCRTLALVMPDSPFHFIPPSDLSRVRACACVCVLRAHSVTNVSGLRCMFLCAGKDQAFLPQFFKQIGSGAFGPIDLSKTVVRGWSGGAQMVSWMIQIMARQSQIRVVSKWPTSGFEMCFAIESRHLLGDRGKAHLKSSIKSFNPHFSYNMTLMDTFQAEQPGVFPGVTMAAGKPATIFFG